MGEIVSWTTRAIGKSPVRYYTARPDQEAIASSRLLYGSDLAGNTAIVVEGPADCWAIGPGAVCTSGLIVTEAQMEKIARFPIRVICFDSGRVAQSRAKKLAKQLSVFPGETHVAEMTSGDDPADAEEWELQSLRETFSL